MSYFSVLAIVRIPADIFVEKFVYLKESKL